MINQSKKAVLKAKLAALNQAMANFKAKCQPAWLIIKQTWYIPFLWSLAWYSYWIFHSAIVLKTPFYEGNTLNYVGVAVSVTALLIAGYRSRRPIKKSVGIAAHSLLRKPTNTTQTDHQKQLSAVAPTTLTRQVREGIKPLTRPVQTITSVTSLSNGHDTKPTPRQYLKDFASECLTCPNLISCTYRQKRTFELSTQNGKNTPCPYKSVVSKRNEL